MELPWRPSEPSTVLIPRTVRRFIARLLVGVMVFAQMAVAAYACTGAQAKVVPGGGASGTDVTMVLAAVTDLANGGIGHAAMDPAQPTLCAAHCQSGQQNSDSKPAPSAPAVMLVSLYPRTVEIFLADLLRTSPAPHYPPLKVDPPHAILHCCFRI